jgi:hypothetical protein
MISFNDLPDNVKVDRYFGSTGGSFITWTKPVGCNFIYIVACGGGGGGNGGTVVLLALLELVVVGVDLDY